MMVSSGDTHTHQVLSWKKSQISIQTNAAKNCCILHSPNWWEKWKKTKKHAAEVPTLVVDIETNSIAIVLSSITVSTNFELWTNIDDPMIVYSITGYICRQP